MRWAFWVLLGSACAPPPPAGLQADGEDGYTALVDELLLRVRAQEALIDGEDWGRLERAAGTRLVLARVTGAWDHYRVAADHLAHAFELAPRGSGPHDTAAEAAISLHRIDEASERLTDAWSARPFFDEPTRARLTLLEGQVHWQRGEVDASLEAVDDALATRETYDGWATLAHRRWHIGDYEGADDAYARARAMAADGLPTAWVALQQGLIDLERGRFDAALDHYRAADAALPGWWLVHEHIAEVLVELGARRPALEVYEAVVARTGFPELQGALAELLGAGSARGRDLVERASASYVVLEAEFPEAVAGHAVAHHLAFGTAEDAVRLAAHNVALRPNGATRLLLARAQLAAGDDVGAQTTIDTILAGAWRTVELHEVAAEVSRALGDRARARGHEAMADAMR